MSKITDLRARLPEIAGHRLRGATWPDIAKLLAETGLRISADELRPYWARLADERHPAEILLEVAEARAQEAESRAAKSEAVADERQRAVWALGPVVGERNKLYRQVEKLQAQNAEFEARIVQAGVATSQAHAEAAAAQARLEIIRGQAHAQGAAASAKELRGLQAQVDGLLRRNTELEAIAARAERAAQDAAVRPEQLEILRREVSDLQSRIAELEEAERCAASNADTFMTYSDILYDDQRQLQARYDELEATKIQAEETAAQVGDLRLQVAVLEKENTELAAAKAHAEALVKEFELATAFEWLQQNSGK